jgi:glutamate-ammonia-ligase adenylyltransferase
MLYELLVTNPKLLELLLGTFDNSRFAASLLVRHPQLLEDTTRDGKLDGEIDVTGHLYQLDAALKKDDAFDYVRAYRQAQLLRILLRDVVGLMDLPGLCREQSALAEACLIHMTNRLDADDLTIVAVGKFGGREITYGADLDVLFIGNDNRAAQKLLSVMAQPTAEGNLPRVDARLRPEGEKGPLVIPTESYRLYYATRAQLWELQALTRARSVIGPSQTEFMEVAKAAWRSGSQQPDLFLRIDDMLQRIRRERSAGSDFANFKTGTGGIIEAEFLVQGLQMRANVWQPNWIEAVDSLKSCGEFTQPEAASLKSAYDLLRRCESILRRYDNVSISTLPADPFELSRLSRRLEFASVDRFKRAYENARTAIHQIYVRRFTKGQVTDAGKSSPALAEQES